MNIYRFSARFCGLAMSVMISACAYPTSSVMQGDKQTGLYFSQPPAEAYAFVDGIDAGPAELFNGTEAVLAVTPGRHVVELRIGSSQVLQKEVYLGDGVTLKIDSSQMEMK